MLTLRSRYHPIEPVVGMLMASQTGSRVLRVVGVTRLARAGDPRGHRYRLVYEPVKKADIPPEAVVHPWRLAAARPPPRRKRRPPPQAPIDPDVVIATIRARRREQATVQLDRAQRVGRDRGVVDRLDFGAGIRLDTIWHRGVMLRAPEVAVERDVPDPDPDRKGRRLSRRARRVDHLHALLRARTITQLQFDAGERLRDDVERMQGMSGGTGLAEPHVDCSLTGLLDIGQIEAGRSAREGLAAIGPAERPVVAWIVLAGGTLDGYSGQAHLRRATVPELLADGLTRLADHYWGDRPCTRKTFSRAS